MDVNDTTTTENNNVQTTDTSTTQTTTATTVEKKEYNVEDLFKLYDPKKGIDNELKTKLDEYNIKEELFKGFIVSKEIEQKELANIVIKHAGSDKEYLKLAEFANKNLSDDVTETISKLLNNKETIGLGIAALKQAYNEKNGISETQTKKKEIDIQPSSNISNSPEDTIIFNSESEKNAAINDKRYGKDDLYTKRVRNGILYFNRRK